MPRVRLPPDPPPASPNAPSSPPPPLSHAPAALRETLQTFSEPGNKAKLAEILAEVAAAPEAERGMKKMQLMVPAITEMCTATMAKYGCANVMMGVMAIQMHAPTNPAIAKGCALLMKAVQGAIPEDAEVGAVVAELA